MMRNKTYSAVKDTPHNIAFSRKPSLVGATYMLPENRKKAL